VSAAQKSPGQARDGVADRAESVLMSRGCRYVAAGVIYVPAHGPIPTDPRETQQGRQSISTDAGGYS
jgi:hypothetical protein